MLGTKHLHEHEPEMLHRHMTGQIHDLHQRQETGGAEMEERKRPDGLEQTGRSGAY